MNRSWLFLASLAPIAALYAPAAEAAETGAIRGQVTDEMGLAVPGAEVVITGVNIAGERTIVTDSNGEFRMVAIPPGPKELTVRKEGFAPIKYTVTIRLDETAFAPVVLKSTGTAGEEIIVEDVLPVVDATRSAVSTQMTTELLSNVPIGRSYQSAVNMVPGVYGRVDTQNGGPSTGNPSVRGEGQYGNNYMVDGISTRDPATKTFGSNVNFDAIQEIQVFTDGYPAEYSNATGMLVNVVTKDGGNEHFGSAAYYIDFPADGGQYDIYNPATAEVESKDKRTFLEQEVSVLAGGPIIKQKLWYFVALDLFSDNIAYEALPEETPYINKGLQGMAKITWFPTSDLSLQYQLSANPSVTENIETSGQYAPEAQGNRTSSSLSHILTGRLRPTEKSELELKLSMWDLGLNVVPASGDDQVAPIRDENGNYSQNYDSFDLNIRNRLGGSLKYTQILDNALGDHKLKAGAEYWHLKSSRELQYTGQSADSIFDTAAWADPDSANETNGYVFYADATNGYPCTAADYSDCSGYRQSVTVDPIANTSDTIGLFAQDDWSFDPITLNLGIRVDYQTLAQNDGTRIVDNWMPAPRLGMAWDVTGDSKTLVSLNAGRYYDLSATSFVSWAATRSSNVYREYRANGDGTYYLAWEQDPVGSPLVYCTEDSIEQLKTFDPDGNGMGYFEENGIDPDEIWNDYCGGQKLRPYHMDKVVIGFKREIVPLFAVGVKGIASHTEDLPEDVDYDLDVWVITNPENKVRDYRALEFTAERKFDGVWQLLASYTLSESLGHMPGQFEISSGGQTGSNGNEVGVYLDDIHDQATRDFFLENGYGWLVDGLGGLGRTGDDSYYGYLPYHSFHQVKLAGSYTLPFGLTAGAVYEFDSGHAWQKRGWVELYGDYFSFPEGRGTRFMPAVHYINLSLGYKYEFDEKRSVELQAQVFNVPGLITPITYYENEGAGFGEPLYRQSPRAMKVGAIFRY